MAHGTPSRHLSRGAVLDAGRGLLSAVDDAMRDHLLECERCQVDVRTWTSLSTLAGRWDEHEPPIAAVRRAKALAPAAMPEPRRRWVTAVLQHLETADLLPAGARGGLTGDLDAYQVVYHAEEFSIDLRVSRTPLRRRLIVVGQIKNIGQPSQRLGSIPVLLTSRSRVAVRTLSNEWGEFSFEHEDQDHLWLEVAPEPGRAIRIPIKPRSVKLSQTDR
jgi:hypothetical protein